jgi:hypothetical protein
MLSGRCRFRPASGPAAWSSSAPKAFGARPVPARCLMQGTTTLRPTAAGFPCCERRARSSSAMPQVKRSRRGLLNSARPSRKLSGHSNLSHGFRRTRRAVPKAFGTPRLAVRSVARRQGNRRLLRGLVCLSRAGGPGVQVPDDPHGRAACPACRRRVPKAFGTSRTRWPRQDWRSSSGQAQPG